MSLFRTLGQTTFALAVCGSVAFGAAPQANDGSDEIPPLRPPLDEIPPTFWEANRGIVISGLVLSLVGLGAVVVYVTRPKEVKIIPPATKARAALEKLEALPETSQSISEVTQVTKRYFLESFDCNAEQPTTTEFIQITRGNEKMGEKLQTEVETFLRYCDQRKFSPHPPEARLNAVDVALRLIAQGEERIAEYKNQQALAGAEPPRIPAGQKE